MKCDAVSLWLSILSASREPKNSRGSWEDREGAASSNPGPSGFKPTAKTIKWEITCSSAMVKKCIDHFQRGAISEKEYDS